MEHNVAKWPGKYFRVTSNGIIEFSNTYDEANGFIGRTEKLRFEPGFDKSGNLAEISFVETKKGCWFCKEIEKGKSPFQIREVDGIAIGYAIDTEGCIEDELGESIIPIVFCPACGTKLPCPECGGEGTISVQAPVYPDAGSPTADIGSAPCPACAYHPKDIDND